MGLTAFLVFIVPWALLAMWLYTLPDAIRLGAPSTPWRPLGPGRDQMREQQRRESIRHNAAVPVGSSSRSGSHNEPSAPMRDGGALGSGPEETEPRE